MEMHEYTSGRMGGNSRRVVDEDGYTPRAKSGGKAPRFAQEPRKKEDLGTDNDARDCVVCNAE